MSLQIYRDGDSDPVEIILNLELRVAPGEIKSEDRLKSELMDLLIQAISFSPLPCVRRIPVTRISLEKVDGPL